MQLQFFKYQGTGNDFVMIDNRTAIFDPSRTDLVTQICDRKFGVGADGLILMQGHDNADFEMIYFNADGSQSLCGNGSRCAVMFARFLGMISSETSFMAIDGLHEAIIKDDLVHLKMHDVDTLERIDQDYFINTGSPHYIRFIVNVKESDVYKNGRAIRYNERFNEVGTNVNFVEKTNSNTCFARTYERGVENETLSCGTGVTAVALAMADKGAPSPVSVSTLGGNLMVSFEKHDSTFQNIWLIGPAKAVFQGSINMER